MGGGFLPSTTAQVLAATSVFIASINIFGTTVFNKDSLENRRIFDYKENARYV